MRKYLTHKVYQKYSFGLRARLSTLCFYFRRLKFGVLRPANFTSDYIEKKQKVGGNPLRLSMLQIPLFYCAKTPALFYTNNGDLTGNIIKLES